MWGRRGTTAHCEHRVIPTNVQKLAESRLFHVLMRKTTRSLAPRDDTVGAGALSMADVGHSPSRGDKPAHDVAWGEALPLIGGSELSEVDWETGDHQDDGIGCASHDLIDAPEDIAIVPPQ